VVLGGNAWAIALSVPGECEIVVISARSHVGVVF
jgi:hypothetical protein